MPSFISEDDIEQALIAKLREKWSETYDFETLNCYTADPEDLNDRSGRSDKRDVILADRVRSAAIRLNPHIPESAIDDAMSQLTARRRAMSMIAASREIDRLLRDGITVQFENAEGRTDQARVRLLDFDDPNNNNYLAVTQLSVKSTGVSAKTAYRRPDVLLYVNGIPLVFIELKNSNIKLKSAYDDNLTNYKHDIPQLFHSNAVCILSNAVETRVGSMTAQWEHFFKWLRVDEKEKVDRDQIRQDATSLERVVDGLLDPHKLLDYVENFVVYYKETQKIIAQNHQFIGVNNVYDAFLARGKKEGKLGVFWHTQGSGKSFSMIFLVRKVFRKLTGNYTFVVVTDREDLGGQIYRNFLHTETVKKAAAAQPKNSREMRKFLGQNKRLVFTLIQKFRFDKGKKYPLLSDRDDIVVMVDEAHRTQYKSLAENMRAGLPNAQYLAFTGTPLLGRRRKTNEWFGDYVSEYNFQQSMDDGATVRLFYEQRVPEVLNQNEDLSEEFYELLEDENLDDAQQEKLEKHFATETEVIKRDDRLDTIAKDIAYHFPRRAYLGKGLVVSLDKFTAVKMYDKVRHHWKEGIKALRKQVNEAGSQLEKERLKKLVDHMRKVEMAVVVSEDAGEENKFKKMKLDIKPHRDRMNKLDEHGHDVEQNFKDPDHPLQLVFVCAMWLTGFDAPTISTLYLDKPMKDHTLMQTIARANRVTSHRINGKSKINGELVDYYNVFRNMKEALKAYAQGQEGLAEMPVQEKSVLFDLLDKAIAETNTFCGENDIHLEEVMDNEHVFKNVALFKNYADMLLGNDERRKSFYVYENTLTSLYEACKPEILGQPVVRNVAVIQYLRGVVESIIEQHDVTDVGIKIGELLDESLVVDDSDEFNAQKHTAELQIVQKGKTLDLSKINFEKLREEFHEAPYKNIEITDLRAFIQKKLKQMLERNTTRIDFAQRLQEIIDRYNAGGSTNENYFDELVKFTQELKEEDERHVREGLTEDELELFDLLKKEKLTKAEEQKVKLAAKALLNRLKGEPPRVLVQDWFKDTQTKSVVRSAIEEVLDATLPTSYGRSLFKKKCESVFDTIVDYASQGVKFAA